MKYLFLPLGIVFGFLLSRAGATTYDINVGLFLGEERQLLFVFGAAILVAGSGIAVLRHLGAKTLWGRRAITISRKPYLRTLIPGALLFGVGWGVTGVCPATGPVMIGEGKLGALITVVGIVLGTYLYGRQKSAALKRAQSAVLETGKAFTKASQQTEDVG